MIRRAAGLGRAAGLADPDHYDKAWAHCDVLVVGGGPAGLAAALTAGRAGARVILCDEDFRLGGRLLGDGGAIDGMPAAEWISRTLSRTWPLPDVRIMRRTTVFGVYDDGTYGALERVNDHLPSPPEHQPRQRLWRIVAKRCVVAAGAIERPIVFAGNDRPGVMMASAMRTYVARYAATPANARRCSPTMRMAGARSRPRLPPGCRSRRSSTHGPDVSAAHRSLASKNGFTPYCMAAGQRRRWRQGRCQEDRGVADRRRARRSRGRRACRFRRLEPGGRPDLLHRGRPKWQDDIAAFVPDGAPPGMVAVGAANGDFGLGACLSQGFAAGAQRQPMPVAAVQQARPRSPTTRRFR